MFYSPGDQFSLELLSTTEIVPMKMVVVLYIITMVTQNLGKQIPNSLNYDLIPQKKK